MTLAANLGFPRMGHRRQLKFALEKFWSGEIDEAALQAEAATLRAKAEYWLIPSRNEFPAARS